MELEHGFVEAVARKAPRGVYERINKRFHFGIGRLVAVQVSLRYLGEGFGGFFPTEIGQGRFIKSLKMKRQAGACRAGQSNMRESACRRRIGRK